MFEQNDSMMGRVKTIHFVGIGGAGMCGIAEILHNLGYDISGSDIRESSVTRRMQTLGIDVKLGHDAMLINDVDVIVVSNAVIETNPEIAEARKKRIPVIPRAEMLAEIMRFRLGIAVAGTHGKTTTTSLIACLLAEGGLDPTYVIGGQLSSIGSNAKLGSGNYLVAEADESDASFLHLQPIMAVLTNIDVDHLGAYKGDYLLLKEAFCNFLLRLPFYGMASLCIDDRGIRDIVKDMTKPFITYGIDQLADFTADNIRYQYSQSSFTVSSPKQKNWLEVKLNLPGKHNVMNALGAITIAAELGISKSAIIKALSEFQGISRRCSLLGEIIIDYRKVLLIDDYAHHPSEIKSILNAVHTGWPDRRIIVVFQPHRFTRTKDLFMELCDVLTDIEVLIMLNIYPAGEDPIPGIDSQSLCKALSQRDKSDPILIDSQKNIISVLPGLVNNNDILLIIGAGDIGNLGPDLVAMYGNTVH